MIEPVNANRLTSEDGPTQLYSVRETAELLAVSVQSVYKLIRVGELPSVEMGDTRSKTRVRGDDLQKLIDAHTYGARK